MAQKVHHTFTERTEAAAAEFKGEDRRIHVAHSPEAAYVADHRPY